MGWRTIDIVVTAVLGVAFGVVFWAWGLVFSAIGAGTFAPPGPRLVAAYQHHGDVVRAAVLQRSLDEPVAGLLDAMEEAAAVRVHQLGRRVWGRAAGCRA